MGSTNNVLDSNGNVIETATYDAFGNKTGNLTTRYQFTGREFDDFSGLYYYRARWYSGELGRFISEDPIGLNGGINNFSYVRDNPVNRVDPSGLYEVDVHYYLTYYLASKTGCFSDGEARTIAFFDQNTDLDEKTSPEFNKKWANKTYHALHSGAAPGIGSPDLWKMATYPEPDYVNFGRYLHYLQDTFSHSGFTNPVWGHARAGHYFDKTNSDPARAVRMAYATWTALSDFAKEKGCDCSPRWTTEIGNTVVNFSLAPGSENATRNSIDSTGSYLDGFKTNPQTFLENKNRILGVN